MLGLLCSINPFFWYFCLNFILEVKSGGAFVCVFKYLEELAAGAALA
jgi:hypothetical protein